MANFLFYSRQVLIVVLLIFCCGSKSFPPWKRLRSLVLAAWSIKQQGACVVYSRGSCRSSILLLGYATLFSTMCVAHSMCSSSSGARGEMYTYNQRIKTRIKALKFNNGFAMYVLSTGYWFFVWCIFLLREWNWYYVLRTWRSRVHVLRKSGIKIVMRYSTFIVQFCTFCIKCQTIYDSKRIFIKQHNSSILCIRSAYFLNTFLQEK